MTEATIWTYLPLVRLPRDDDQLSGPLDVDCESVHTNCRNCCAYGYGRV
jgi:hypothetical protein